VLLLALERELARQLEPERPQEQEPPLELEPLQEQERLPELEPLPEQEQERFPQEPQAQRRLLPLCLQIFGSLPTTPDRQYLLQ